MFKKRVVSGIRATGQLHLGNFLGAVQRFADLSQSGIYECFYFIADLHSLTTFSSSDEIKEHMPNIVLDYIAAGVDPEKSTIYVQSSIPEVTELSWLLSCLIPAQSLINQSAYKDKVKNYPEQNNAGLLNYPVLMAADILGVRGEIVPVGKDQEAHLELATKVARKFNQTFGDYFPVPDALRHEMITVPGLSPRDSNGYFPKMGKSDNNTINLSDSADATLKKIMACQTDPKRITIDIPGDPNVCPIFQLHGFVSSKESTAGYGTGCSTATIGCVACKSGLALNVNDTLAEFRDRRAQIAGDFDLVRDVVEQGRRVAAPIFKESLEHARECFGLK